MAKNKQREALLAKERREAFFLMHIKASDVICVKLFTDALRALVLDWPWVAGRLEKMGINVLLDKEKKPLFTTPYFSTVFSNRKFLNELLPGNKVQVPKKNLGKRRTFFAIPYFRTSL